MILQREMKPLQFQSNSRLLIMRGAVHEGTEHAEHCYELIDGGFKLLSKMVAHPVKTSPPKLEIK
ncbi:hypothetical protein [Mariprofundus sp. EBB-1]|uniref:hypothetical protein n=1 Tax=Mariprofundus sp. EBB-1 TaxID=2650971 RepID=UPI0011C4AB20|nr:hypothetical protein [Mariprofundus sp. EBB-1]